jgi:hypothetical protein
LEHSHTNIVQPRDMRERQSFFSPSAFAGKVQNHFAGWVGH